VSTSRLHSLLLWILPLAFAAGCGGPPALFVQLMHEEQLTLDQVRFTVELASGSPLGPLVQPSAPAGPIASGETLRLLLPDAASAQTGTLRVEGLWASRGVATGENGFIAPSHGDLEVQVVLLATQDRALCEDCRKNDKSCPRGKCEE
jgi:hypothetical protein